MNDPTTEGYAATAAEIEGMVRNLCAYALSEPDPMQRYVDLTHQQVLFDGVVAAIRRERGRALADLVISGMPVTEVAAKTNLATVPRVRKLISTAGETERVKAATARKPARTRATKATKAAPPAPVAAPTGKRVLTAAELVALGLQAEGPIPAARPRRPRRAPSAAATSRSTSQPRA